MKIVFRVDSLNHEPRRLLRCLALAQGLRETEPDSEIIFLSSLSAEEEPLVSATGAELVRMESFGAWDAEATAEEAGRRSADMIVLDNPHADEGYVSALHEKAFLAVIDDSAPLKRYDADAIINPALNAHMLAYPPGTEAELFLGTDFALFPQSLDRYQDQKRDNPDRARKILICFGNDPNAFTIKAVHALKTLQGNFTCTVVTGAGFSKGEELASEAGLDPRFIVIREQNPSRRFEAADLAIADPAYLPEILFFSLPSLLASRSRNEEAEYAARNGMAQTVLDEREIPRMADMLICDKLARDRISARMAELVDGLGRFRLAEELISLWHGKGEPL